MWKLIVVFLLIFNITSVICINAEPPNKLQTSDERKDSEKQEYFLKRVINNHDVKRNNKDVSLDSKPISKTVAQQPKHNQDLEKSKNTIDLDSKSEIKAKENLPSHKNNVDQMNKTDGKNNSLIPVLVGPNQNNNLIQSGALLRGFYVFLGLSVLTVMYFLFKSYRLRHRGQPFTMIHKYGVTARKSDMEMRPLELDDDEDDNTLFEINSRNGGR